VSDRLELIARMGAAIERAPDDTTKALLRDALAALVEDHGTIAATERRREKDRRRKRGDSTDSAESVDSTERAEVAEMVPPSPSPSFPEPHITPSSPPSAAATAASDTPAAVEFDAVEALLAQIPEASRPAWRAEIAMVEQAMHGPSMTAEQVQRACRDYVGNENLVGQRSLRHFRAYLADAARPAATPRPRRGASHSSSSSDADADQAWVAVLELLPAWQRREITAEMHKRLDARTRRGLSAIGGFRAIAETPDAKRVWVRQEFAKAFNTEPASTSTATVP
jgi:hypothetical protein